MCAYVHVPGSKVHAPGLPANVIPILPVAFWRKQVLNIPFLGRKVTDCSCPSCPLMRTRQIK
jgi:hypothetical protein